jgi:hypothetical protein
VKQNFLIFAVLMVLGSIPLACGSSNNPTYPAPTPTPTSIPLFTHTVTSSPTVTNSPTPTLSPTITATLTRTGTPTVTLSPTYTLTATSTFTPTQSPTPTITFTITNTPTMTNSPTVTNSPTITSTPTITPTPQTITVTISEGSLGSYSGYYYTATGSANNTATGVLTISAHVGDTIVVPNVAGFHPLYFDADSTTCLFDGEESPDSSESSFTYQFPATGTYYFHCGIHATNCSLGLTSCGSTNCESLAALVNVN